MAVRWNRYFNRRYELCLKLAGVTFILSMNIYVMYSRYIYTLYIYIYVYICSHENNVPSRLSPQWFCGNSCTWVHVRFQHSVCLGSLMTTYIYIYIIYIYILCIHIYIIYMYMYISYMYIFIYMYKNGNKIGNKLKLTKVQQNQGETNNCTWFKKLKH